MAFTLQDNPLFVTFGDVDLGLCVQKLLAPIPFGFHLQFQLALKGNTFQQLYFTSRNEIKELTSISRFAGWND